MREFLRALGAQNYSPRTVITYSRALEEWRSFLSDVGKLKRWRYPTPTLAATWRDRLRGRGLSPRSVNVYLAAVGKFYRWLEAQGLLGEGASWRVDRVRVHKSLPRPLQDPAATWRSLPHGPAKLALGFGLFTGLRASEILSVRPEDVSFHNVGAYYISVRVKGKGGKERITYSITDPSLQPEMQGWIKGLYWFIKKRPSRKEPIFAELNYDALRRACKVASRFVDERVTPHRFRHTFATLALRAGLTLGQVRLLLGHSRIDTTLGYAEIVPKDIEAAVVQALKVR